MTDARRDDHALSPEVGSDVGMVGSDTGPLTQAITAATHHQQELLGLLDHNPTPQDLRGALDAIQAHRAVVEAMELRIVEASERNRVTESLGLTTAEWLHRLKRRSLAACHGLVRDATMLCERHADLVTEMAAGNASHLQVVRAAEAINVLPDNLTAAERSTVNDTVSDWFHQLDPRDLANASGSLLDLVAPGGSAELDEQRRQRRDERARKNRGAWLHHDAYGTTHLRARLGTVEGAELERLLDTFINQTVQSHRRAKEAGDLPDGYALSDTHVLRADALMTLIRNTQYATSAPEHGGDRPRINITMALEDLRLATGVAHLNGDTATSVADIVSYACDADLVPVVLNQQGLPAWVGTGTRSFTGAARVGVVLRDGGCAFPGCDRPPPECEIHHLIPWWNDGPTSIDNGVCLCRHHHRLVEPGKRPNSTRWEARMGAQGRPEFLPPTSIDPLRRARQHRRYRERTVVDRP